uniref:VWFA domain-containing protein n=1 Tax=Rhabditophanes sp. KR3021 TaxID=114890 RepID=A0AC35TQB6_9BILA
MQLLGSILVSTLIALSFSLPITNDISKEKATTYVPCQADILFAIDASNDALTTPQFNSQIHLLKNNWVTSAWTNFERVGLAWYNSDAVTHYGFETMNSKREFDLYTENAKLTNGTDFKNLLDSLLLMPRSIADTFTLNTFIFVSYISPSDIQASIPSFQQLKSHGSVNIIILGNALTSFQLTPFGADRVISWDFSTPNDALGNFVMSNIVCSNGPTPSPPKVTTTLKPTTTATLEPTTTIPKINTHCNAYVSFSVDASSDVLDLTLFQRQIAFIEDPLTLDYKGAPWHKSYHTVALIAYAGRVIDTAQFGQLSTNPGNDGFLDNIEQEDGMSLATLLPALNMLELDFEEKLNTVIFISETLPSDIRKATEGCAELLKRGSLIFVAMGDEVDASLLRTLPHTAVIEWPDMLVYDHQLLRQEILGNFACDEL